MIEDVDFFLVGVDLFVGSMLIVAFTWVWLVFVFGLFLVGFFDGELGGWGCGFGGRCVRGRGFGIILDSLRLNASQTLCDGSSHRHDVTCVVRLGITLQPK